VADGPPHPPQRSRRSGGFALIIVLWTLVLIAFIAAHLVSTGRVETRIAANLMANAAAEAAAEGAVNQVMFALFDPRPETSWPTDGAVREVAVGDCRARVQVRDEAARINPNIAAPELMAALLQVAGADEDTARRLSEAIRDWVGTSQKPEQADAAVDEYRAAGLDYGPPAEPFETLEELLRVIGMTPSLYAAIRPHLSLFAPAEPALWQADPAVVAAAAAIGQTRGRTAAAPDAQQPEVTVARISVIAECRRARASRTAVAEIDKEQGIYTMRAWYDGVE
jgi:general secretion pathway protein K